MLTLEMLDSTADPAKLEKQMLLVTLEILASRLFLRLPKVIRQRESLVGSALSILLSRIEHAAQASLLNFLLPSDSGEALVCLPVSVLSVAFPLHCKG